MEELITYGERAEFAPEVIKQCGFIRAKYHSWQDFRNGLVTFAGKNFLRVLFQTGINAATSYYTVKVAEVTAGLWQIIYTPDLEKFYRIDGKQPDDDIDLIAEIRRRFKEEN